MPRKKITVNKENALTVRRYIERKISLDPYWPAETDQVEHWQARKDFSLVEHGDVEGLAHWCREWLSAGQWKRLQGALRAQRKRKRDMTGDRNPKKTISLDQDAWQILSDLAKRDKVTISKFLVRRLEKEWLTLLSHKESKS